MPVGKQMKGINTRHESDYFVRCVEEQVVSVNKNSLPPQDMVRFRKAQLDLPCGKNMKSTDSSREETSRCEAERFLIIFILISFSVECVCSEERDR